MAALTLSRFLLLRITPTPHHSRMVRDKIFVAWIRSSTLAHSLFACICSVMPGPKMTVGVFAVTIHEADVRRPFPAADDGLFPGDFGKFPAEGLNDGTVRGDRRGLGEVAGEDDFRGMVLQPGIVGDLLGMNSTNSFLTAAESSPGTVAMDPFSRQVSGKALW